MEASGVGGDINNDDWDYFEWGMDIFFLGVYCLKYPSAIRARPYHLDNDIISNYTVAFFFLHVWHMLLKTRLY